MVQWTSGVLRAYFQPRSPGQGPEHTVQYACMRHAHTYCGRLNCTMCVSSWTHRPILCIVTPLMTCRRLLVGSTARLCSMPACDPDASTPVTGRYSQCAVTWAEVSLLGAWLRRGTSPSFLSAERCGCPYVSVCSNALDRGVYGLYILLVTSRVPNLQKTPQQTDPPAQDQRDHSSRRRDVLLSAGVARGEDGSSGETWEHRRTHGCSRSALIMRRVARLPTCHTDHSARQSVVLWCTDRARDRVVPFPQCL